MVSTACCGILSPGAAAPLPAQRIDAAGRAHVDSRAVLARIPPEIVHF